MFSRHTPRPGPYREQGPLGRAAPVLRFIDLAGDLCMKRMAWMVCALALLAGTGSLRAGQDLPIDLAGAAANLANKLGAELVKRGPKNRADKFRLGVFPFGNKDGRYTLDLGDNGPALRGALTDALRTYL